jgi:dUTP pyrophosphatase
MLSIFSLKFSDALPVDIRSMYKDAVKKHNNMQINDPHPNAGFDLFLPLQTSVQQGSMQMIDLMVSGSMDDGSGNCLPYTLEPRSSISKSPLRLANGRGIIDSGYRGNLMACCDCIRDDELSAGARYFQILHPSLEEFVINIVDDLDGTTRGDGGIGSTGI